MSRHLWTAGDDRGKGLLVTVVGVLVISPDSLLVRLISADEWTVLFWRGLLSGLAILGGLLLVRRRDFLSELRKLGLSGLGFVLLFAAGTILFVVSLAHTSVANTLFIISTAPLFAAVFALVFLRETVALHTWLAIFCALGGVAVIASGSVRQHDGSVLGDLAAVGGAISLAGTFSIARLRRPQSMVPATGLAGILTALLVLPFSSPLEVSVDDFIFVTMMGLLVVPLGFSLMTLGPRYLPAPEVSLLLLLEAVIGPLWVWLFVDEVPARESLLGGTIVLVTLAALNLRLLYRKRAI